MDNPSGPAPAGIPNDDARHAPHASHHLPPASATIPTLSLSAFLGQVASILHAGLPQQVWLRVTIAAGKATRYGHQLELTDAASPEARLQAFLPSRVLAAIAGTSAIDPAHLIGMTTLLLVEPSFSVKWHLQARIADLGPEARLSLERQRIDRLRSALKAGGLYDRQRRLPVPADVTRVAVIYPDGAAGWADIRAELLRWQGAGLVVVRSHPAPFEGERAVAGIVAALTAATSPIAGHAPDLVVMVRGGGARSGMAALDDERVVRAACTSPIPILVGLGHAIDRSLLDEVAWATADTPSKALAVIQRLIREAAARAVADAAAIQAAAKQLITSASQGLDRTYSVALAAGGRSCAAFALDLGRFWATIQEGLASADRRLDHLADETRRGWRDVLAGGEIVLTRQAQAAADLMAQVAAAGHRCLDRVDDGRTLLTAVVSRSHALIGAQSAGLHRLALQGLIGGRQACAEAETNLAAAEASVAASDINAVLARGFVLALDRDRRLLRSSRDARTAQTLDLLFHDGSSNETARRDRNLRGRLRQAQRNRHPAARPRQRRLDRYARGGNCHGTPGPCGLPGPPRCGPGGDRPRDRGRRGRCRNLRLTGIAYRTPAMIFVAGGRSASI